MDRIVPKYRFRDPDGFLFHAASYGETKALLQFSEKIKSHFERGVYFSVLSDSAYRFLEAKKKSVFLMPIDLLPLYSVIFKQTPTAAFFFETEIWPSYIFFLKKRGCKLILVNARMSERSFRLYRTFGFFFAPIMRSFDKIIAKSESDARRYRYFGAPVEVCGNIKSYREPIQVTIEEVENLKDEFLIDSDKPLLAIGSAHREELAFILELIRLTIDEFYVVIAPRHMEDNKLFFSKLSAEFSGIGRRSMRKSGRRILLLDTMGELEGIYRIADAVFVAGSCDRRLAGHNPMEPLVYGKPVVTGIYVESFKTEVEMLERYNLIRRAKTPEEAHRQLLGLMDDKGFASRVRNYFKQFKDVLDCYINQINEIL